MNVKCKLFENLVKYSNGSLQIVLRSNPARVKAVGSKLNLVVVFQRF
jgi:hypothetical protein